MFKAIRAASLITALLVATTSAYAANTSQYGNASAVASAQRHIVISEKTKHVNVNDGETVEFRINGTSFTWHFSTLRGETAFNLAKIAPAGVLKRKVTVYVAANPLYNN